MVHCFLKFEYANNFIRTNSIAQTSLLSFDHKPQNTEKCRKKQRKRNPSEDAMEDVLLVGQQYIYIIIILLIKLTFITIIEFLNSAKRALVKLTNKKTFSYSLCIQCLKL
jgi:hypothetical protein